MPESVKKKAAPIATTILMASVLLFAGVAGHSYNNGYNAYSQENSSSSNSKLLHDIEVTKPTPGLTAQWWQWASSFPRDENPMRIPLVKIAARAMSALPPSFWRVARVVK